MVWDIVFQLTYKVEDADWSRDMRGKNVISAIPLRTWLVLCTTRDEAIAQDFVQTLVKVNPPMGIQLERPEMYVNFVNICACFCLFMCACVCVYVFTNVISKLLTMHLFFLRTEVLIALYDFMAQLGSMLVCILTFYSILIRSDAQR